MVFQAICEDSLKKGLEVYVKEEHIVYKDVHAELVASKEIRMVKARVEYWQTEYVHPYGNSRKALHVVYRRLGTNELNQLPIEHIFFTENKPHCLKCNRSFDQLTIEICSSCHGIICPYHGACNSNCSV